MIAPPPSRFWNIPFFNQGAEYAHHITFRPPGFSDLPFGRRRLCYTYNIACSSQKFDVASRVPGLASHHGLRKAGKALFSTDPKSFG